MSPLTSLDFKENDIDAERIKSVPITFKGISDDPYIDIEKKFPVEELPSVLLNFYKEILKDKLCSNEMREAIKSSLYNIKSLKETLCSWKTTRNNMIHKDTIDYSRLCDDIKEHEIILRQHVLKRLKLVEKFFADKKNDN